MTILSTGGLVFDYLGIEPPPDLYEDINGGEPNGIVIGTLTINSDTFHSIGMVWEIGGGDQNHDAVVTVKYRKVGDPFFKNGLNLIRCDYLAEWGGPNDQVNNFAGSLMFLTPGTAYEVVLELLDPDGGSAIRVFETTTRAIPVKPTGSIKYCVEGTSGGDGSTGSPWQGLAVADANASPGDVIRLRPTNGAFARATLSTSGDSTSGHIVYEEDPADPGAVIDSIELDASYLWFDNLTFTYVDQSDKYQTFTDANVNTSTDRITLAGHNLSNADDVSIYIVSGSTGDLPAPLVHYEVPYYVKVIDVDEIELYETADLDGAPNFDPPIDITSNSGGGTYAITDYIENAAAADVIAIDTKIGAVNAPHTNNVITDCTISGYMLSINGRSVTTNWTVTDNTVTGLWLPNAWGYGLVNNIGASGIWLGGEGRLGRSGNVIAYNKVTGTQKAILTSKDSDIYGNDVVDNMGSAPNTDGESENVRIYGNRIQGTANYSFTFQAQVASPWYYCYNQVADRFFGGWKLSSVDRLVLIGNTFFSGSTPQAQFLTKCISRNNVWMWSGGYWGGRATLFTSSSNMDADQYNESGIQAWVSSNVDYDGYYFDQDGDDPNHTSYPGQSVGQVAQWGTVASPNTIKFLTIAELYASTGMQEHGIAVKPDIFANYDAGTPPQTVAFTAKLVLETGTNAAVAAGEIVPNLADFHTGAPGTAPDLGCHHRVDGPLQFGPRSGDWGSKTEHWSKH